MKITAPMAGNVWKVLVEIGDDVTEDTDVIILESMKMEIFVTTHIDGKVTAIYVHEGQFINEGDALVEIKEG